MALHALGSPSYIWCFFCGIWNYGPCTQHLQDNNPLPTFPHCTTFSDVYKSSWQGAGKYEQLAIDNWAYILVKSDIGDKIHYCLYFASTAFGGLWKRVCKIKFLECPETAILLFFFASQTWAPKQQPPWGTKKVYLRWYQEPGDFAVYK